MKYSIRELYSYVNFKNFGFYSFLCGILFLPSSLFLGLLFLFPSALVGSFLNKKNYFKDKWNYPFFIFGFLILLSSILQNFVLDNPYKEIWDPKLSFIGMSNWLPFIWLFWAFQPYLKSIQHRKLFAIILVSGTFPIILTGFGQYFFNWHGPFETVNGLIIWYQRPINNPGGLSGLFNHQNYAGSWLNLVWPFCLALFFEKRKYIFRKTIEFSFLFSVGFAAFLTFSRNAWIGLLTPLPIIIGKRGLNRLLPIICISICFLIFIFSPIFSGDLQNSIRSFFPEKILLEFSDEGYKGLDVTRFGIYSSALKLIKSAPFFGIGAGSFPPIYFLETNFWKGHTHNLLLELSISYGIPITIIFFIAIITILFLSSKTIFINKNISQISLIDKAIWASLFFFLLSQLVDIQYLEGRISIIVWILIASLKNIIETRIEKINLKK